MQPRHDGTFGINSSQNSPFQQEQSVQQMIGWKMPNCGEQRRCIDDIQTATSASSSPSIVLTPTWPLPARLRQAERYRSRGTRSQRRSQAALTQELGTEWRQWRHCNPNQSSFEALELTPECGTPSTIWARSSFYLYRYNIGMPPIE